MSSRKDELIDQYAADIKGKFGEEPNMDLLRKVTIGLGPAIYNMDSSKVSGTDDGELETVRKNFLIKKLGMQDGPHLMVAIKNVLQTYGVSERNKHRAVVYYILAKHFKKESIYD